MEGRRGGNGTPRSWNILPSRRSWSLPRSWPILGSSPYWFKCVGPIVDRTPGPPPPFQLTPFDPPSEISKSKPCHLLCVLGHAVSFQLPSPELSRTSHLERHLISEAPINYVCSFTWPSSFWKLWLLDYKLGRY